MVSPGEASMKVITWAGSFTPPDEPDGAHWVEQLRVADLSVGSYSIPRGGRDDQEPHTEDEIYVVTAGRAVLEAGEGEAGGDEAGRGETGRGETGRGETGRGEAGRGEAGRGEAGRGETGRDRVAVGPGSVVFVPAGEVHRFTDVTEDLATIVVFAPAEGARDTVRHVG
jgi:mannose-6-phosphate isomerase-like protein (cupin superfamily)